MAAVMVGWGGLVTGTAIESDLVSPSDVLLQFRSIHMWHARVPESSDMHTHTHTRLDTTQVAQHGKLINNMKLFIDI